MLGQDKCPIKERREQFWDAPLTPSYDKRKIRMETVPSKKERVADVPTALLFIWEIHSQSGIFFTSL